MGSKEGPGIGAILEGEKRTSHRTRFESITASRECSSEINHTTDSKTSLKHNALGQSLGQGGGARRLGDSESEVWALRHHARSDDSFRSVANADAYPTSSLTS